MDNLDIFTLGFQTSRYNTAGSLMHKVESFEDLRNLAKGKSKEELPLVFPTFGQRGKEYFNVNTEEGNNTPRIGQLVNLYMDKFDCSGLRDYEVRGRALEYYTYNCPTHLYGGSNVVLVDIDTTVLTQSVMQNADKINELCNNSILLIQPSFSGKLHIIMHIRNMNTIEEYQRESAIAITWLCKAIEVVVGTDPFTIKDHKGDCCIDPTSYSAGTSIAISDNDYILFPNCWQFEIPDEQRKKVCKVAGVKFERVFREKVDYAQTNPFGSEFTITNPHKVKVDRKYIVGDGWKGNDVRMQFANVLLWYCKGDADKFNELRKELFANYNQITPVGDRNVNPLFKAAFDKEFGVVTTTTNIEYEPTATSGIVIPKDGWLTDYMDTIEQELESNRRIEVVSPTGTGKTVLITEYAKKHKTLIIVPFNSQLVNYGCDWINIISKDNKDFDLERSNVAVYDQAIKHFGILNSDWDVIVDECHLLWCDRSWRESATDVVNRINDLDNNKVMLLTATNTIEDSLFNVEKTLTFTRERDVVEVKWMDVTTPYSTIEKLITDKKKTCVFSDRYAKSLASNQSLKMGWGNVVLCHSESKSKGYQRILDNQMLDAPLTVSTKILYSGNNFNNQEPIRLIIQIDGNYDYSYIVQSVGRFRKCQDLEVFVVNDVRQHSGDAPTDQIVLDRLNAMRAKGSNIAKLMTDRHKDDKYYNPYAAVEIEDYYLKIDKEKIIADLCATSYIKVVDCGMCDDGKEFPMDEVKRRRSAALIDNIRRCSNLNELVKYDEEDDAMTNRWKSEIGWICADISPESVKRYIVERSDESAIQIDTIISEMHSIINISELSLSEIRRIKDNYEAFADDECNAYGVDGDTKDRITMYAKRISRLLNRVDVKYPSTPIYNLNHNDLFGLAIDLIDESKIELKEVRRQNGQRTGTQNRQPITIKFVGNCWDDSGLEGMDADHNTITFECKGDCMRFLGIGSKAFSRLVKGERVKAAKNWQVVQD